LIRILKAAFLHFLERDPAVKVASANAGANMGGVKRQLSGIL
jgi:hypothetical protein